jgi:hypothetical protein
VTSILEVLFSTLDTASKKLAEVSFKLLKSTVAKKKKKQEF